MPTPYDADRPRQLDEEARGYRYYRNAVGRHWDPHDIELGVDRRALRDLDAEAFERLKVALAKFGAGEQSVTEDLAPLAVVLEDVEDQLFLTTQLYEEAKHTDFFDHYWRSAVHPAEDARGEARSAPVDPAWFDADYVELFERNERAMARLLTDDTADNRARAYCHYHLAIEGILAQTGYYGLTKVWGPEVEELPELPGLVEGINRIRQDEGRHVGFGMAKLRELVLEEGVDPGLLSSTVGGLVELIRGTLEPPDGSMEEYIIEPDELTGYAVRKHAERLSQITEADAAIPDVEELTALDG